MIIRKWVIFIRFSKIDFKGLRNTRDVGQVYTTDGRKVKSNVLFRSGRIDKLSNKKIQEFLELKNPSRNLIASLIDRIEITEDKNIDIYYKFKLV